MQINIFICIYLYLFQFNIILSKFKLEKMDNELINVNIIIIGDAAVGKTCLMSR